MGAGVTARFALLAALLAAPAALAQTPSGPIAIELNGVAPQAGRCRLTFVVVNKGVALSSLKLDLAAFERDGGVARRVAAELGPLRAAKTQVRAYDMDLACDRLGSVLVNDVTACAPASPEDCLDRLSLAHRGDVRLFK